MSHSCPNLVSTSFLYNPYIPFLISLIFFITSLALFIIFLTIDNNIFSFHNHSKEMGYTERHNPVTQITLSLKSWGNAE